MQSRNRTARLFVLACGEPAAWLPENEHFDTWLAMTGAQPHMVCRALITEGGGHSLMYREMIAIAKSDIKLTPSIRPFM